ncbi:MAG: cobalamin biosynthesis protein [Gammaproteobacteria bacterium]|nr:cobalamin biosynthesis protein [Gammaproteobacteria bacterium]MBU1654677.1 cobalamin biosynthesis protein [Gammaproteobacteria bacterium]MBU1961401.1 cobalamin biosynthesis protein [Gammaproteobacteria bacterium]
MTFLNLLLAVVLDWLLGEPCRWHPLVGFGRLADRVESVCQVGPETVPWRQRLRGIFALLLLLTPPTLLLALLASLSPWGDLISIAALYFSLGHRSLHDHARPVAEALAAGDEAEARRLAGRLVSRDPETLDIPAATTESVLENGNDGVFGALFWFLAAGAPGAVCYRLANTLDAMWGYKDERRLHFGWAAARLDDLLNYLPARLTALTYALLGNARQALRCWRGQAPAWESPNAGPVMAAGAGALNIALGGPARYRGEWHQRPPLGAGPPAGARDIGRALALVRRGVVLWLAVAFLVEGLVHVYP